MPDGVVIDKSGANLAGLHATNVILKFTGAGAIIKILHTKYLNNILEQPSRGLQANPCQVTDHRFIKRITAPPLALCSQTAAAQRMIGLKAFHSVAATIAGIEAAHMIRKGQCGDNGLSAFQQFAALAA